MRVHLMTYETTTRILHNIYEYICQYFNDKDDIVLQNYVVFNNIVYIERW